MNLFEKLDSLTPPPIIDTIGLTDKAALDLFEAAAETQLLAAQKLHATALAALEDGNLGGLHLPVSTLSLGIVRHYTNRNLRLMFVTPENTQAFATHYNIPLN